jgi:hypothetical protein
MSLSYEAKEVLKFLQQKAPDSKVEILKSFPVLWSGWECDSLAWVVSIDGKRQLVTTNHGRHCFESLDFLDKKLVEYAAAASDTNNALDILRSY